MGGATPTILRRARGGGDMGLFSVCVMVISTPGRGAYVGREFTDREGAETHLIDCLFVM